MNQETEPLLPPEPRRRSFWGRLGKVAGWLGLIAAAGVMAVWMYPHYEKLKAEADSFDLKELAAIPAISEVFDCNGQRYSRLDGAVRYVVPLAKISPNFIKALLAREDSRFYQHHGVDFQGIFRAACRDLREHQVAEGASTLTQQLARNTYFLDANRWRRKCVEALLALRIERNLTKDQILEDYANRIYYGGGLYGVETASRACFGKPSADLTLSEAAILAGLIRSPNRFNPLEDTHKALVQRDQVLARMVELGTITPKEADAARAEEMPATKLLPPVMEADYAMDAVRRDLAILLPREVIDRGGLKIYTTIDRRLQLIAQDAVEEKLAALEAQKGWPHPVRRPVDATSDAPPAPVNQITPYIQGALLAVDNQSGGIRAIVGGRDYHESPYNRALQAERQVGSTFKPFVYATAFAHGLLPGTLIDDAPLQPGEVAGVGAWSPENSDEKSEGLQPAALGLIHSRNTMTVRVGEFATLPAVRDLAVRAGLGQLPNGPAIFLGAFETTLKNLVGAYTMFPNNGMRRQPYIIEQIVDRQGQTIYRASHAELQCLSPSVTYVVHSLLGEVLTKGTAANAAHLGLTIHAAGKTGTTDDYKDAWFVGYTTRLTCGVWVGLDKPERIMDHGYGAALALPIWTEFMEQAAQWKYECGPFPVRVPLQVATLSRTSGQLATAADQAAGTAYEAQLPTDLLPAASGAATPMVGVADATGTDSPPVLQPFLPPDGTTASASPAQPAVPPGPTGPPVRRAFPVNSAPVGAKYQMIRQETGFVFQDNP